MEKTYGSLEFNTRYIISQLGHTFKELEVIRQLSNVVLVKIFENENSNMKQSFETKWYLSTDNITIVDQYSKNLDFKIKEKPKNNLTRVQFFPNNKLYEPVYVLEESELNFFRIVDISKGIVFTSYNKNLTSQLEKLFSTFFNFELDIYWIVENFMIRNKENFKNIELDSNLHDEFIRLFNLVLACNQDCIDLETKKYIIDTPIKESKFTIDRYDSNRFLYRFFRNGEIFILNDMFFHYIELFVNRMLSPDTEPQFEIKIELKKHYDCYLFKNIYNEKFIILEDEIIDKMIVFLTDTYNKFTHNQAQ